MKLCALTAALALASACSGHAAVDASAAAQAAAPACHDKQKKADGTCCPSGQAYEFSSDSCFAVGPPECAEVIFNNPEKCVPKWCWDWQDADKKPCEAFSDGCDTAGRLCTSEEIAAGGGCPAGTFPLTEKLGDCAPAGYFPGSGVPRDWNGDLATLPPVPPLEDSIPAGIPPLTTLPDVNNTFFCIDEKTKEERFCTEAEMKFCHRGPKGEMPDEKKCVYVGVPWPSVCPPGFIVDEKAVVAEGLLPPCLPDPADCGDDEYGDAALTTEAGVLFVNAVIGNDGNPGMRDKPFKTIGKAIKVAGNLGVIAVAAGTYNESLAVTQPVVIRGRCAAMVNLNGLVDLPVLAVKGKKSSGQVKVHSMRLGGSGSGIQVTGGPGLTIERLLVAGVSQAGIYVVGDAADLTAQSVVVSGSLPRPSDKKFGLGLDVENGAHVTLQDVRLSANRHLGLLVSGAATLLEATHLQIDGTLAQESDNQLGRGASVQNGAQIVLTNGRITANRDVGIYVSGAQSALSGTRLLVDGTLGRDSDALYGDGIKVQKGAQVILADVRLSGNTTYGLEISDDDTLLTATRLLVDGTLPRQSDKLFGMGVIAMDGAQLELHDARLSANRDMGLLVATASAQVSRLLVDATRSQESDKRQGLGMVVLDGADVNLTGARLTANRQIGLGIEGTTTTVVAAHLLVDGTLPPESDGDLGEGITVFNRAHLELADARLSANRDVGLFAAGSGVVVTASRVVIDGTLPKQSNKENGLALAVVRGAQLRMDDARLSGNRDQGLTADGEGAAVFAARWLVDGTLAQESNQQYGRGFGVQSGASLKLQSAALLGNREAALFVSAAYVQALGVVIAATLPTQNDQTGGSGVWLEGGTNAVFVASALSHNRGAALAVENSAVEATDLIVLATAWSSYADAIAPNKPMTLADGVMLNASPNSSIHQCLIAANERAGILVEASPSVKITHTLINGNIGLYGLVFQHTLDAIDQFNPVFGASVQDRAKDAGLSLPAPPQPVKALSVNGKSP